MPMLLATPLLLVVVVQDPEPERFPDQPLQDALRYDLDLHVDLAAQQLQGRVQYAFAAVRDLTTIRLDAQRSERWQVAFTDAAGRPMAVAWDDTAGAVVLTLPEPLRQGQQTTFSATLQGTPVDGFYFRKNRYGDALAFTDHYAIRARGWLPCEDHPADRARFSLRLTYPRGLQAIAYGVEANAAAAADDATTATTTTTTTTTAAFAHGTEIPPYMWALAIGPFARVPEAGDARLVDHFVYRQDVEAAKPALQHHAKWLATMEQTFGAYAFGKYTTVQCPTRWGGFEAPGTVLLAENLFDQDDRGVSTLAHELVHMWFGDAVGYARWREVWLSEGFASYFGPWLWSQTGGPELRASMAQMRTLWLSSRERHTKSVRDDRFPHPDQALNMNTYQKGAWVLHMLRAELGDEKFFAALAVWYRARQGSAIVTADFVTAIEQSSGADLGWFFRQWLDRKGCPELQVDVRDDAIAITQTQPGEPYRAWLSLRWRDEHDAPHTQRVRLEAHEHRLPRTAQVRALEIDPDVELLFAEKQPGPR